jgi:hypothetical protein
VAAATTAAAAGACSRIARHETAAVHPALCCTPAAANCSLAAALNWCTCCSKAAAGLGGVSGVAPCVREGP